MHFSVAFLFFVIISSNHQLNSGSFTDAAHPKFSQKTLAKLEPENENSDEIAEYQSYNDQRYFDQEHGNYDEESRQASLSHDIDVEAVKVDEDNGQTKADGYIFNKKSYDAPDEVHISADKDINVRKEHGELKKDNTQEQIPRDKQMHPKHRFTNQYKFSKVYRTKTESKQKDIPPIKEEISTFNSGEISLSQSHVNESLNLDSYRDEDAKDDTILINEDLGSEDHGGMRKLKSCIKRAILEYENGAIKDLDSNNAALLKAIINAFETNANMDTNKEVEDKSEKIEKEENLEKHAQLAERVKNINKENSLIKTYDKPGVEFNQSQEKTPNARRDEEEDTDRNEQQRKVKITRNEEMLKSSENDQQDKLEIMEDVELSNKRINEQKVKLPYMRDENENNSVNGPQISVGVQTKNEDNENIGKSLSPDEIQKSMVQTKSNKMTLDNLDEYSKERLKKVKEEMKYLKGNKDNKEKLLKSTKSEIVSDKVKQRQDEQNPSKPNSSSRTVVITISLLSMAIAIALTLTGVRYRKISVSSRRFADQAALLSTEDDVSLFNRQTYQDVDPSQYESWKAAK